MTTPGFPVCGKSGLKNSVIVTLKNVKTASSEESGLRFFYGKSVRYFRLLTELFRSGNKGLKTHLFTWSGRVVNLDNADRLRSCFTACHLLLRLFIQWVLHQCAGIDGIKRMVRSAGEHHLFAIKCPFVLTHFKAAYGNHRRRGKGASGTCQ